MKVYFDENLSHYVARAFNLFECKIKNVEVISTVDALYAGAPDEEVVEHVAKNGGILFTKDCDYLKAQLIVELMRSHKIGLVYMKTQRKEEYWDTILLLTKAYINARNDVFFKMNIPFCYEVMPNGTVKKLCV